MSENIPNVLAGRYASSEIKAIWSEEGRIVLERRFWIAVMRAQRKLGLDVPEEGIRAYEGGRGSGGPGLDTTPGSPDPARR